METFCRRRWLTVPVRQSSSPWLMLDSLSHPLFPERIGVASTSGRRACFLFSVLSVVGVCRGSGASVRPSLCSVWCRTDVLTEEATRCLGPRVPSVTWMWLRGSARPSLGTGLSVKPNPPGPPVRGADGTSVRGADGPAFGEQRDRDIDAGSTGPSLRPARPLAE